MASNTYTTEKKVQSSPRIIYFYNTFNFYLHTSNIIYILNLFLDIKNKINTSDIYTA